MPETYWKAQENRVRKVFEHRGWVKARRTALSGALKMDEQKGDVAAEFPVNHMAIRVDHKSTRGALGITINRRDIDKIEQEGRTMEEFGFVTFGFKGAQRIYAVLPLSALLTLLETAPSEVAAQLRGIHATVGD